MSLAKQVKSEHTFRRGSAEPSMAGGIFSNPVSSDGE